MHNLGGYFLGYWSARLLKLPEKDCSTIAIEVGMQNAGLASGIANLWVKLLRGFRSSSVWSDDEYYRFYPGQLVA